MLDIVYNASSVYFKPKNKDKGYTSNMLAKLNNLATTIGSFHFNSSEIEFYIWNSDTILNDDSIRNLVQEIANITKGVETVFRVENIRNTEICDETERILGNTNK